VCYKLTLRSGAAGDTGIGGYVTLSCKELVAAVRTVLGAAEDSRAPQPAPCDGASLAQAWPAAGLVTAQQCQGLAEMVDEHMWGLPHEERQQLNKPTTSPASGATVIALSKHFVCAHCTQQSPATELIA